MFSLALLLFFNNQNCRFFTNLVNYWKTRPFFSHKKLAFSASSCYNRNCLILFSNGRTIVGVNPPFAEGNLSSRTRQLISSAEKGFLQTRPPKRDRPAYIFLYSFLPSCQAVQLADEPEMFNTTSPVLRIIYALILFVLTTGIGLFLFEKKDLD